MQFKLNYSTSIIVIGYGYHLWHWFLNPEYVGETSRCVKERHYEHYDYYII